MQRSMFFAAIVAAAVGVATADPVDVAYSVSGSAGNWTLDFSVTNNLNPADMDVYFFGVYLDTGRNIAGSPSGFDPNVWSSWNNAPYGGSNIDYNNNWIDFTYANLLPGQTLSGFQALYTGASAPTSVNWFAFGFSPSGGAFDGSGYFNNPTNPGFEGVAVPVPASAAILGLGGLAAARRRR